MLLHFGDDCVDLFAGCAGAHDDHHDETPLEK
jgi:hypothetical protein